MGFDFRYFSNQMTISRLLGLELDSATVRRHIEDQFVDVMSRGMAPVPSGPVSLPAEAAGGSIAGAAHVD